MNELDLANLVDPKKQRKIIAAMLQSKHAIEVVKNLRPKDFSNDSERSIFLAITKIYEKKNTVPTEQEIVDFLEDFREGGEDPETNLNMDVKVLRKIYNGSDDLDEDYLIPKTMERVSKMQKYAASYDFIRAIAAGGDIDRCLDRFQKETDRIVIDPRKKFVDFSDEVPELLEEASKVTKGITFGITELDNKEEVSLVKGTVTVLAAASNIGKSWFCSHIFCNAIRNKASVLYLSLETGKLSASQRVVSTMTKKSPKREDHQTLSEEYKKLREVAENGFAKSVIAEFPIDSAKESDIRASIESFKLSFGNNPELVIVDGISDIHQSDSDKAYSELGRVTAEFRNMANDYDCAFVTTAQANRGAYESEIVTPAQMGDSIRIFWRADTVLSLGRKKGCPDVAVLAVIKARNGKNGGICAFTQNLSTGQFFVAGVPYDEAAPSSDKKEWRSSSQSSSQDKVKEEHQKVGYVSKSGDSVLSRVVQKDPDTTREIFRKAKEKRKEEAAKNA